MSTKIGTTFTPVGSDTDERNYFVAALFAIGFSLADNSPGITHVYSAERKYEHEQRGDVRYLFNGKFHGIPVNDFIATWKNPDQALRDAEGLPARIRSADTPLLMLDVSRRFELVYLRAAIAHMRLVSLGRINAAGFDYEANDQEKASTDFLDTAASRLEQAHTPKHREVLAKTIFKHWKPAMVSWLKAYRGHVLELNNLWKEAPESIKIDTGDRFPIIIPKGPKFKQLLERWT
tara:strand:- start:23514 stop:24215 length:702 start_codon:yes stop_codon:yes gene_type:complete